MDLEQLQKDIPEALASAEHGLPDEVFSLVASIVPMVNVDLLVQDGAGRTLLAWREYYDDHGWHIPGGIIRFKETFEDRLHRTAIKELGTDVTFDPMPLKISELFMPYQRRGHFISFLYRCYLPEGYEIRNEGKMPTDDGYLAWHEEIPPLVNGQQGYEEFLADLKQGKAIGMTGVSRHDYRE